jgi:hypothetical protein
VQVDGKETTCIRVMTASGGGGGGSACARHISVGSAAGLPTHKPSNQRHTKDGE